jgi:hypothetical protein
MAKIYIFPKKQDNVSVEIFRNGSMSMTISMPEASYRDAESSAALARESVEMMLARYVCRVLPDYFDGDARPRRDSSPSG